MSGWSDTLEGQILQHAFGVAKLALPTVVYVSLHTSDPTDVGDTSTEVQAGEYARQLITFDPVETDAVLTDLRYIKNSNSISFPTALTAWGVITHVAFWNRELAPLGKMIRSHPLDATVNVQIGDVVRFQAGKIRLKQG